MQSLSKAKHSLTAMAKKEVCPLDEIADPPGTVVLPIDIHGFAEGLVSFRTLCGVQSSLVRHSVFQPCVLLSRVLKLDDVTLLHPIVKSITNELAETVCSALRTAVAVFAHRMCTIWCKSLYQPLKCSSLTPHEAPELAKLQAESYVGVR